MLRGKHIVLGVTGGIAAYKACELVRLFVKQGAEVRVMMSANAARFVTPATFETLTGNRVASDTFEHSWEIEHISLAKFADLCVIAPATANIIAKMASGIADDIVSTSLLAMPCKVLVAPAMNTVMWRNAATQANVRTLFNRGISFVGPGKGALACGDSDDGRMSEPEEILEAAEKLLNPKRDLEGLNVLVTAGATREMLDPVRYLTNRSTGRMGYAICRAALDRGAKVDLVSGITQLEKPEGAAYHEVVSTQDMYDCVTALAKDADVVIQAAAPADFTVEKMSGEKIKKTGDGMALKLVNTKDIAKKIGEDKRPGQVLVAFAAETDADPQKADEKRRRKNADLIVLNDVTKPGAGFAGDTNIVTIISGEGAKDYPLLEKYEVAQVILDEVMEIRKRSGGKEG
ncbi:MAG: bifunctional phosphopantothenoylcysteine decarboxylase/phosphopantothenate--cysteine ligase CoaBC [Clostridia bacterium]|nr:bifunctional phosphopantothenoylcysteine decarboxylase/phosphopantothenate--cysteine ligase CoaBC [Clostridia bacterium]